MDIRVGVVGCGYWGAKHVRVLASMGEVGELVVIDSRRDIRERVMQEHAVSVGFDRLGDGLDAVDAVVIATPPESHAELAAEALEAGKHCLVEKPLATSSVDAQRLYELAEERRLTLAVGHTFAYDSAVWKMRELVDSGRLGQLHFMDSSRLNLGLYRHDVNVLWDLAVHDISIAVTVLDDVPDAVSAWGARHTQPFAEDVASLRMSFERRGMDATVRSSWLDPVKVRRTTLVGSERMVVYDDLADERIRIYDRGRETRVHPVGSSMDVEYRHGDTIAPALADHEPLRAELEDFVRSALTGVRPIVDGWDGLVVVRVLEAADRSCQEGGVLVPTELPARSGSIAASA